MSQQLKKMSANFPVQCFQTRHDLLDEPIHLRGLNFLSIWEETLYKAWSSIVETLIPNHDLIHKHLSHFMSVSEAEEVVLFEKSTFLVRFLATISTPSLRDRLPCRILLMPRTIAAKSSTRIFTALSAYPTSSRCSSCRACTNPVTVDVERLLLLGTM